MGGVKSKQETLWLLLVCEVLVFGAGFVPSLESTRPRLDRLIVTRESPKEGQDPDLFDYFDPLLSPHQYPNGISPENKLVDLKEELDDVKSESDSDDSYQGEESVATKNPTNQNEDQDLFDYFDPLRSPHEYPNGITPNIAAIDESEESQGPRKVGVLLMDHGSKNEASNSRLKHLAELYQLSTDADKESIVVEYSHMEIASPSIPEGLEKLMNMGVGKSNSSASKNARRFISSPTHHSHPFLSN